jgi:hypothetical protein
MPVASPFQLRIQQMHNHEKLLSLQVNEFTIKTKIPQLGNYMDKSNYQYISFKRTKRQNCPNLVGMEHKIMGIQDVV